MDDGEFLEVVRQKANVGSTDEARRVTQETFEVLAEHLGSDKARELGARLPSGIGGYLPHGQGEAGKAFALDEFVDRVYELGDALHPEETAVRARAVLQALDQAATSDEAEKGGSLLPQELPPLLGEEGPAESGLPGSGG